MDKQGIKIKIFLILLGIIAAFILLEVLLQVTGFIYSRLHLPAYELGKLDKDTAYIFCFGDSFTYGIGAGFKNSYPAQLEKILNAKNDGKKYKVYNFGVPGDNSAQVLNKFKKVIDEFKPDMVIVLAGNNDVWNLEDVYVVKNSWMNMMNSWIINLKAYKLLLASYKNSLRALRGRLILGRSVGAYAGEAVEFVRRGDVLREKGKFKQAEACYYKALALEPKNETAFIGLAGCCGLDSEYYKEGNDIWSFLRILEGRLIAKKSILLKEKAYGSGAAEVIRCGNVLREERKFKQAEACYYKALALEPKNKTALIELTRCCRFACEYKTGLEILFFLLKAEPDDPQAYQEIDELFIKSGDMQSAIAFYSRILEEFPGNELLQERLSLAYKHLAGEYFSKGDLIKAQVYYRKACQAGKKNKRSIVMLRKINALLYAFRNDSRSYVSGIYPGELIQKYFFSPFWVQNAINENIRGNLSAIIKLCAVNKIKIILLEYPEKSSEVTDFLAREYNVPLVGYKHIFAELLKQHVRVKYFVCDGHCTAEGYRVMAETIAEEVLKILK